jgi:hypothetical protein
VDPLDPSHFAVIASIVQDTPFTVTPYFFLRRGACDIYCDSRDQPRFGVVVPHTPCPDVYVFGASSLEPAHVQRLADFLAGLEPVGGFVVPVDLVPPLRARRRMEEHVEGLCFTYRPLPRDYAPWRPELVRALTIADVEQVDALPDEAAFLYMNYGNPATLLTEGLTFGVFQKGRLVSMAASLALTPKHCEVGVYTRRRYRSRGYATDCVEVLFAHVLSRGICPLWRIGGRQKVAIYFAEKLEMDEIGTDGQEVYLRPVPGS